MWCTVFIYNAINLITYSMKAFDISLELAKFTCSTKKHVLRYSPRVI